MMYIISSKPSGFMLFNVLASLSIIVLMTMIAIPFIKNYQPNLVLDAVGRDLTSDLRLAQQLTISEQIVHVIKIDEISDSYSLLKIDTSTTTIKTVNLPEEVMIESVNNLTNNEVKFNFYGGVSESGTIILENINAKTGTINIRPSGYVYLEI